MRTNTGKGYLVRGPKVNTEFLYFVKEGKVWETGLYSFTTTFFYKKWKKSDRTPQWVQDNAKFIDDYHLDLSGI